MNDAAVSLLKVFSALISIKASIKYISIPLTILATWRYFTGDLGSWGVPAQYVEPISVCLGIGIGSLVGEVIYICMKSLWHLALGYKLSADEKAEERRQADAKYLSAFEKEKRLVDRFQRAYPHFSDAKKKILQQLSNGDAVLPSWFDEVQWLKVHGYISIVVAVSEDTSVYTLNSILSELVKVRVSEAMADKDVEQ